MVNSYNGTKTNLENAYSQTADSRMTAHALNYVLSNCFYVEIDNNITACFSECSGLSVDIPAEPHFEGGQNNRQHLLIGQAKFSEVTLKRGVTNDLTFWNWMKKTLETQSPERRNVNILVFDRAGETMQSWYLHNAIAVKWAAPALQADADSVAIEELTLAYEGIDVSGRG